MPCESLVLCIRVFFFFSFIFFLILVTRMPALDLLFYQPAAWEKEPWQQMLTCGGSELDGLHR